jgi:ATP-dependent DNA helicase RecG
VFDNFIIFYNPGKLYGDLTIEDLQTNTYHASARNKLIAEAFYLTGDIEKYGSGFRRIRDEISTYPTMELEYAEIPNGFQVIVKYEEQKISTKNFTEIFTENLKTIFELIKNNPSISFDELSEKTGISRRAVINNTNKLKSFGILERVGADKGGYWKITK